MMYAFLIFPLILYSFISPQQIIDNESFIIGSWQLSKITVKIDKAEYEMPIAPTVHISAVFSADGKYTVQENGQTQISQWKWLEENKKLEITHKNHKKQLIEITNSGKTEWTYVASEIKPNDKKPSIEQKTALRFANLILIAYNKDWEKETANVPKVQFLFTMKYL